MTKRKFLLHIISIFALALFIAMAVGSSSSEDDAAYKEKRAWIKGGTLHKATVQQWKSATSQNKLATAGDWLAASLWSNSINTSDDLDRIKVKARQLVRAVDYVVDVKGTDEIQVNEVAGILISTSNELGP